MRGWVELPPRPGAPRAGDIRRPQTWSFPSLRLCVGGNRPGLQSQCPVELQLGSVSSASSGVDVYCQQPHVSGSQLSAAGSYRAPRGPHPMQRWQRGLQGNVRCLEASESSESAVRVPCGPECSAWLCPWSHGPPGEPSGGDA